MSWLRWWWPTLVWAALIFLFSTDWFSWENTSLLLLPILRKLFPTAQPDTLAETHHYIRKCAHLAEYFIFSLLLVRGIRGARRGWRLEWGVAAVAAAAGWAALDELHQAFVPSRGPSMIDVLIDASGAFAAQIAFAVAANLHARHRGPGPTLDSPNRIV